MIPLSETFSETLQLSPNTTADVSLSQAVLENVPPEAQALFQESVQHLARIWQTLQARLSPTDGHLESFLPHQTLRFGLVWVTDTEIQALNTAYRSKDSATDVLTFSLLEDEEMAAFLPQLPEVDLGEIYVSIPWALRAVSETESEDTSNFFPALALYTMTRVTHGILHLLGVHHETMDAYNIVVAHQDAVIQTLYA